MKSLILYVVVATRITADAFTQPLSPVRQRFPIKMYDELTSRKIISGRPKKSHTSSNLYMSPENNDNLLVESQRQKNKLTREFFTIAIPAFFQLAAEPLAGLVDTAYLGRLGPEVLGGAGVAISAQYAMSKLYNDPLLRTSISLVASEDGKAVRNDDDKSKSQALSIAISSALLLAFTVGMVQLVLYFGFASAILRGMGVTSASNMYHSAFCKCHPLMFVVSLDVTYTRVFTFLIIISIP